MCNPEKSLGFGPRSGFELGNLDNEGWCGCTCYLPSVNLSFSQLWNGCDGSSLVILSITHNSRQSLQDRVWHRVRNSPTLVCQQSLPSHTSTVSRSFLKIFALTLIYTGVLIRPLVNGCQWQQRLEESGHSTPSGYPAPPQASGDWMMNKDLPCSAGTCGVMGGWRYGGGQVQKMTVHTVRGNERCN